MWRVWVVKISVPAARPQRDIAELGFAFERIDYANRVVKSDRGPGVHATRKRHREQHASGYRQTIGAERCLARQRREIHRVQEQGSQHPPRRFLSRGARVEGQCPRP